jgi:hypothetical protein
MIKQIRQSDLSSECWTVQIFGLKSCDTCEVKDTDECGGKSIRKTGKNENGKTITDAGL